jgi:hypothetical protein
MHHPVLVRARPRTREGLLHQPFWRLLQTYSYRLAVGQEVAGHRDIPPIPSATNLGPAAAPRNGIERLSRNESCGFRVMARPHASRARKGNSRWPPAGGVITMPRNGQQPPRGIVPYRVPEKRREFMRKWRAANGDKLRKASQKWRTANLDKVRAARGTTAPRRQSECDPRHGEPFSALPLVRGEVPTTGRRRGRRGQQGYVARLRRGVDETCRRGGTIDVAQ